MEESLISESNYDHSRESYDRLRYYSCDSESEDLSGGTLHINLDMFIRRRQGSPTPSSSICSTARSKYTVNSYPAGATTVGVTTITTFNQPPPPHLNEFVEDSSDWDSRVGRDEPARPLKRPRPVWTPQLHKRFVDAVAYLGIKNAVPKTIMQLMSVVGLTLEDVASHLQKYGLYLKRMQGLSRDGAAIDQLFASTPVPPQFLYPATARHNSVHSVPYMLATMVQATAATMGNPQLQSQHNMQKEPFLPRHWGLEHSFFARQTQQQNADKIGTSTPENNLAVDLDSTNGNGGRKLLPLFPTGRD